MVEIFLYLLFGFFSGIIGGMGMGGGTILIPLLTFFTGVSQNLAQGINLLSFLPMSVIAILIHAQSNLIKFNHFFITISSGIISALLGSIIANNINSNILKMLFGIFLILLSLIEFIKILKK